MPRLVRSIHVLSFRDMRLRRSRLGADRSQQKRRQMPAVVGLRRTGRGFSRPSRTRLVEAGHRRAGALALRGMLAAMPTAAAAALLASVLLAFVRLAGFATLGCLRRLAHPRNA